MSRHKIKDKIFEKLKRLEILNMDLSRKLEILMFESQVLTNERLAENHALLSHALSYNQVSITSLSIEIRRINEAIRQPRTLEIQILGSTDRSSDLGILRGILPSSLDNDGSRARSNLDPVYKTPVPGPEINIHGLRQNKSSRQDYCFPSSHNEEMHSVLRPQNWPSYDSLDILVFHIRSFYTTVHFDESLLVQRTQFWKDTSYSIYLLKVSDQTRALDLLQNSTIDSDQTFAQTAATILIELLGTLSPVNTTVCRFIRPSILRSISASADKTLPRGHPVPLVINKLEDEQQQVDRSLQALDLVCECLRQTLGPAHELTLLATSRLISLLRRSRYYAEALRMSRDAIDAVTTALGPTRPRGAKHPDTWSTDSST